MTYQGERARPIGTENGQCFDVSKVRIGPDGHASNVPGVKWMPVRIGSSALASWQLLPSLSTSFKTARRPQLRSRPRNDFQSAHSWLPCTASMVDLP